MSSADITPQFNPLSKAGCPALIPNSTERVIHIDSNMNEEKNSGSNFIIHRENKDAMI
jgi:hypothetical protein